MDYFTFFQGGENLLTTDVPTYIKVITYIISVIVGGVLYKYFNRWLSYSETQQSQQQQASDTLVENMEVRIRALGQRITDLESKREESYERELKLTKMLAKAEQEVESLKDKVETLERNQSVMSKTVDKYYQKYGPLDEIE